MQEIANIGEKEYQISKCKIKKGSPLYGNQVIPACRDSIILIFNLYILIFAVVSGCGGIGRRAGFRCLCPSGRGGSTPLIRIVLVFRVAYAACQIAPHKQKTRTYSELISIGPKLVHIHLPRLMLARLSLLAHQLQTVNVPNKPENDWVESTMDTSGREEFHCRTADAFVKG